MADKSCALHYYTLKLFFNFLYGENTDYLLGELNLNHINGEITEVDVL